MANHPQHPLLASSCWPTTLSRAILFSVRNPSKVPCLGCHSVHHLLNQPSICIALGLGSECLTVIMFFLQHFCAIPTSGITNWSAEVTLPKVHKGVGGTFRHWTYTVILVYSPFHTQVLLLLFFKLCTHYLVPMVGQTRQFSGWENLSVESWAPVLTYGIE